MDSKELEWITDVAKRLQEPVGRFLTYNEHKHLTEIMIKVAPALIAALDYTAVVGFISYTDDDEPDRKGQSCNGCGHDHWFDKGGPKHKKFGTDRDGNGGEDCCIEHLFHILAEEQKNEDK